MNNKFAIFTPQTCSLWCDSTNEIPGKYLKRLAILFKYLVIAPVGIGKLGEKGSLFTKIQFLNGSTKEELKYEKELEKIVLDIDEFSTDPNDAKDYDITSDKTLWFGENNSYFIDFVIDYVCRRFNKKCISDLNRSEYEYIKIYIGDISADYHILSTTINKFENFSTVFSNLHRKAIEATYFQINRIDDGKVISEMESINMLDFGNLSWDQIIELRKSEFLKDFRKKINEWVIEYSKSKNINSFENNMRKYVNDSKFDFIEKKKPELIKTSILGLIGNLPSPTLINPVGAINSIVEFKKDSAIYEKYKWLYFLQQTNKISRE